MALRVGTCFECDGLEGGLQRLARDLAGPDVIDERGWVGGWSAEKTRKWRAAFAEAERRLTKTCVEVRAEYETVALCRDCVERLLTEFPTDEGGRR